MYGKCLLFKTESFAVYNNNVVNYWYMKRDKREKQTNKFIKI